MFILGIYTDFRFNPASQAFPNSDPCQGASDLWGLLGFTGVYWVLLGFTGGAPSVLTGVYWGLLGSFSVSP